MLLLIVVFYQLVRKVRINSCSIGITLIKLQSSGDHNVVCNTDFSVIFLSTSISRKQRKVIKLDGVKSYVKLPDVSHSELMLKKQLVKFKMKLSSLAQTACSNNIFIKSKHQVEKFKPYATQHNTLYSQRNFRQIRHGESVGLKK